MKISIDILSGAGRKTAAAILVTYQASLESQEIRFLLDAGGALEVGEAKGWTQPDNLDAIFMKLFLSFHPPILSNQRIQIHK